MKKTYYKFIRTWKIITNAIHWFIRDVYYSEFYKERYDILNRLLIVGHVIEKGITMPNRKLGFGYGQVRELISLCKQALQHNKSNTNQFLFALQDLCEYQQIHQDNAFELPKDIQDGIDELLCEKTITSKSTSTSKEEFFAKDVDFKSFANSRRTLRNFSDEKISNEVLNSVFELAQTAPSACNRQSVRVHIYDGDARKDVLKLQNGNRGWGDMADKVFIVTSEQTAWDGYFTKAAYLDGGIYTMNLLYALHYYGICACCLNLYLPWKEMKALRKTSGIPDSEIPVIMIAIGYPPKDDFLVANSNRIDFHRIITFHN